MNYKILNKLETTIDSVAFLQKTSIELIEKVEKMQETAIIVMTPLQSVASKESRYPTYFDFDYNSLAFIRLIKMLNKRINLHSIYSLVKNRLLKAKEIATQVMDYHFEKIPKLISAYRDYIQFPSRRDFPAFRSAFCNSFPNFSFYKQRTYRCGNFPHNTFNVRVRKTYRAFMKYMQTEYLPQRGLEMDPEVYSLIKNHL